MPASNRPAASRHGASVVSKGRARIFSFVFGAVFAVAGLGVIGATSGMPAWLLWESRNWEPVAGEVLSSRLDGERPGEGAHRVVATYRYHYQGRDYLGDAVSPYAARDNIGSYWRDLAVRLAQARQRGEFVPVYVHPRNPERAWLDRTVRWGFLLFGTGFGGIFLAIGVGVIWWESGGHRRSQGAAPGTAAQQGQTRIESIERYSYWLPLAIGTVFALVVVPAYEDLLREFRAGDYMIAFVLVFPVVGVGMLVAGARNWRRYRYFGPTPLLPDPVPGQAGGQVGGDIHLARPWGRGYQFTALLSCIRRSHSGSGKNSRVSEHLVWQREQRPYGMSHMRGSLLRVCFDVPQDLPASGPEGARERILWRLHVEGEVDGRKLCRTWELPVACGSQLSRNQLPERHVREDQEQRTARSLDAASTQIRVESIGNGLRLTSRAGRNVAQSTGMIIFGSLFGGGGLWMFREALQGEWLTLILAIPFSLIGLLFIASALWMLGRSLTVDIRNGDITSRRRWLGIPVRSHHGRLERSHQLSLQSNMRSGTGHKTIEYVNLTATQPETRTSIALAETIAGREVAEALKAAVVETLRLP